MAKFQVIINTDNAAFGDMPEAEIATILRGVAQGVEQRLQVGRYFTAPIRDTNGNTVGKYVYTK